MAYDAWIRDWMARSHAPNLWLALWPPPAALLSLISIRACARAFIVSQLSVLFGILFVISCNNLWAVILCHAFYNTVAFVCFVNESPKYSNLELPN